MDDFTLENVVSTAIATRLGDLDYLPEDVHLRIQSIYKEFFNAYMNIARMKADEATTRQLDPVNLDPEILTYMQHFFSDYQHIYRRFRYFERIAKSLLRIDRHKFPAEYETHLNLLFSEQQESENRSILQKLLGSVSDSH
jgi:hypothetical protein